MFVATGCLFLAASSMDNKDMLNTDDMLSLNFKNVDYDTEFMKGPLNSKYEKSLKDKFGKSKFGNQVDTGNTEKKMKELSKMTTHDNVKEVWNAFENYFYPVLEGETKKFVTRNFSYCGQMKNDEPHGLYVQWQKTGQIGKSNQVFFIGKIDDDNDGMPIGDGAEAFICYDPDKSGYFRGTYDKIGGKNGKWMFESGATFDGYFRKEGSVDHYHAITKGVFKTEINGKKYELQLKEGGKFVTKVTHTKDEFFPNTCHWKKVNEKVAEGEWYAEEDQLFNMNDKVYFMRKYVNKNNCYNY